MEAEDFAAAGIRFTSGAVGSLVASTAVFPHRRETITLHFEKGSVYLGPDTMDVCWSDGRYERDVDDQSGEGNDEPAADPATSKHRWHQAVLADFLNAINKDHEPMVSGREAMNSHHLIDAIEKSSQTGKVTTVAH